MQYAPGRRRAPPCSYDGPDPTRLNSSSARTRTCSPLGAGDGSRVVREAGWVRREGRYGEDGVAQIDQRV